MKNGNKNNMSFGKNTEGEENFNETLREGKASNREKQLDETLKQFNMNLNP